MSDAGIKISKFGIDVNIIPTETNIKDFIVLDQKDSLLVYQSGVVDSTTTINHNFGYLPLFDGAQIASNGLSGRLIRTVGDDWDISGDINNVYITKNYAGSALKFFYIIFINE